MSAAQTRFRLPAAICVGERNDTLFRFACQLRSKNLDETEIENAVLAANEQRCEPPLDTKEVAAIAASACRYPGGSSGSSRPILHVDVSKRPQILIRTEELAVNDAAVAAVAARVPSIFSRAGKLVEIRPASKTVFGSGTPQIVQLARGRTREILASAAEWVREKKGELSAAHPPAWAVDAVHDRGHWAGIPELLAVTETPVLLPDGEVLAERGYDPRTGLFLSPLRPPARLRAQPTQEDARRSCSDLLEVVADFPFASPVHRAGWLAAVLTLIGRFAINGPVPLVGLDSNAPGVGKSTLADTIGIIGTGRRPPRTPQFTDEQEARKRITTIALNGDRVVLLDNVDQPLGNGCLDAAITGLTWSDRLLGSNRSPTLPLHTCWLASGNNLAIVGDLARRCLHVRLESPLERPEERQGFRHPRLLEWVEREQPRLAAAAITVLRGFCVAGRPSQGLLAWGSFEAWSALVRDALVWAGQDDPGEARGAALETADPNLQVLRTVLATWSDLAAWIAGDRGEPQHGSESPGITVLEALKALQNEDLVQHPRFSSLLSALLELSPKLSSKAIGRKLAHLCGRVVDGRRLARRPNRHATTEWRVEEVRPAGEAGFAGFQIQPLPTEREPPSPPGRGD